MRSDKYILDGKKVIRVSLDEWARWFELADRHIGNDMIGKVQVSTVFLGLDHNLGTGKPLLFETMIFGGKRDEEQYRYSTYAQAERGHKKIVAELKAKK